MVKSTSFQLSPCTPFLVVRDLTVLLGDIYLMSTVKKNTPFVGKKMLSHTLTHEKQHSDRDVSHHVLNLLLKCTFMSGGRSMAHERLE